jgi:hypothetical protein
VKQQQRMTYLLESYLAVLAKTAQSEPAQAAAAAAESFTIADLARGSGVQRALTASAARANIKDPQLAGLARNEQDLQRRINTLSELLTGLLSASPDQQLPGVQAKIRSDIVAFKAERETIKKEIETKAMIGQPESVRNLMRQGLTVSDVYQPYVTRIGTKLQKANMTMKDPWFQKNMFNDKGELKTLWEMDMAAMQHPDWEMTDEAHEKVGNFALSILRDFGLQG